MAVVTLRVLANADHSVLLNKSIFGNLPPTWRAECCCGWRGNIRNDRYFADREGHWHIENHVIDRWIVAVS